MPRPAPALNDSGCWPLRITDYMALAFGGEWNARGSGAVLIRPATVKKIRGANGRLSGTLVSGWLETVTDTISAWGWHAEYALRGRSVVALVRPPCRKLEGNWKGNWIGRIMSGAEPVYCCSEDEVLSFDTKGDVRWLGLQ